MIQRVFDITVDRVSYLVIGIVILISSCQNYWYSNPVVPSTTHDSSNVITCKSTLPFEQNIIGTWHIQIKDGTSILRTGTVTFNADKTIFDPDSVYRIFTLNKIKIIEEVYSYETITTYPLNSSYGKLFIVHPYGVLGRSVSLGFSYNKVVVNECNHILLGAADGGTIVHELDR